MSNGTLERSTATPLVLVVDDFRDTRTMYAQALAFHGFSVLQAANGEEAVHQSMTYLPDVVVMDLGLPGIDGWEATRRLKADARTRHIPILAVTGIPDAEHRSEGFADVFMKPCSPAKVLTKVRDLLEQRTT